MSDRVRDDIVVKPMQDTLSKQSGLTKEGVRQLNEFVNRGVKSTDDKLPQLGIVDSKATHPSKATTPGSIDWNNPSEKCPTPMKPKSEDPIDRDSRGVPKSSPEHVHPMYPRQ